MKMTNATDWALTLIRAQGPCTQATTRTANVMVTAGTSSVMETCTKVGDGDVVCDDGCKSSCNDVADVVLNEVCTMADERDMNTPSTESLNH